MGRAGAGEVVDAPPSPPSSSLTGSSFIRWIGFPVVELFFGSELSFT